MHTYSRTQPSQTTKTQRIPPALVSYSSTYRYFTESIIIRNNISGPSLARANPATEVYHMPLAKTMYRYRTRISGFIIIDQGRDDGGVTVPASTVCTLVLYLKHGTCTRTAPYGTILGCHAAPDGPAQKRQKKPPPTPNPWKLLASKGEKKRKKSQNEFSGRVLEGR
ncbi:hypothetical protein B9Z19DRAFT_1086684 [Tuber borchii]|uniref:Uncharacterized protein n=1 Tax=Tuber borchii TaxID=42251 RepID=A0A2T6ZNZ9_TUBBO|nr:hypothetical protein B9Z19DRAFT_1086684 [Tuber borchii]